MDSSELLGAVATGVERKQLVPPVHVRDWHTNEEREGGLRCVPPAPTHSPWVDWFECPEQPEMLERILQNEQSERERCHPERLRGRADLPIEAARERLLQAVRTHSVTLVAAETGSGKSTQVPQYLLDDAVARGHGAACHIVCTQPRRIAAVSLAERVCWERGESKSGRLSTGHVVRWDEHPPRPYGSIVFCTVGSLLPRLARLGASHIVVDEAHTRDVHTDLLLTVLPTLLKSSPDLRVVVMSATFNTEKLLRHFGEEKCAVVEASGRPHKVRTFFLEDIVEELAWQPPELGEEAIRELPAGAWDGCDMNRNFVNTGWCKESTVNVVRSLEEHLIPLHLVADLLHWVDGWPDEGGVLVFLPGWEEIAACERLLRKDSRLHRYEIVKLHSTVPPAEQKRALWPACSGRRKVILSTDIAETSLTIPDVLCVVDSGVARVKNQASLSVVWASQANLLQRRGRAGRVRSGTCVHLLTRERYASLDAEPTPEMQRVPLEEVVLAVCDLGLDEADCWDEGACAGVSAFLARAPDPPDPRSVRKAFHSLQRVGALNDNGYLTPLGAIVVRLPLPPATGAALFLGGLLGAPDSASLVASTLDEREPWARKPGPGKEGDAATVAASFIREDGGGAVVWSDSFATARALREFNAASRLGWDTRSGSRFCIEHGLIMPVMHQLSNAAQQLKRTLSELGCEADRCDDASAQEGVTFEDTLESSWPIIQTLMAFAFGWNLGELVGGRRVDAGWSKPARLSRTSVFCNAGAREEPPCNLLAYAELASGNGGRVLRGATMLTPHQLLLFGGSDGPCWDGDAAIFEKWLRVRTDLDTAVALGRLRAVTRLALQYAAKRSLEERQQRSGWRDAAPRPTVASDPWLCMWRDCVRAVARAPLPEPLPERTTWDDWRVEPVVGHASAPQPWPSGAAADVAAELAAEVATSPATLVAGSRELPLPCGWSLHADGDGQRYYACVHTGASSWHRPSTWGPDGSASVWRWTNFEGQRRFVRQDAAHRQLEPPSVGDAVVLPLGWEGVWDSGSHTHYYWHPRSGCTSWIFPSAEEPFLEVN